MKEQWETKLKEIWNNFNDSGRHDTSLEEVRDFIHSLLASQRETLAVEIEGMKEDERPHQDSMYIRNAIIFSDGYNAARTDAAAHIRKA